MRASSLAFPLADPETLAIAQKDTGEVEYHVPRTFSPDRPAVTFSHAHHDVAAASHPTAAKVPRPSLEAPVVVGDPEELSELVRGGNGGRPLALSDYLTTDRTVLGVHLITFRDRSCLTLSWPHLAFDAMGKSAILKGLTLALQGREDEIPAPIGHDNDPLAEFGKHAEEPHLLADRRLGTPGMIGYGLRNVVSLAGPKETRVVCVPAAFWQKMYADVRDELAREAKAADSSAEAPFVSEGDVLSAWWTRLLCASWLGRKSDATVAAQNSMSLRKVLAGDLLPPGRPFVSMALGFPTVLHPARDLLGRPLSWLAREFRRAIVEQGTRAQVEAYAALQRDFDPSLRMPVFFGDSGMYNIFYSNWHKAGLFDFDFAGAAERPRDRPLRASYIQCVQDPSFPEGWVINGKDAEGNYWIFGFRAKGLWAKLEQELEKQVRGEVPL